jgi:hypothetical protein
MIYGALVSKAPARFVVAAFVSVVLTVSALLWAAYSFDISRLR